MNNIRLISSCFLLVFIFIFGCNSPSENTTDDTISYKNNDNTVRFRLPDGPAKLNPAFPSGYENLMLHYLYQYLMDFDEETFQMAPQIIKSDPKMVDLEDGGQAFTFEILEEAVWDNGAPITGYDYEFTLKAIFNPHINNRNVRAYLKHIKDVEVDVDNPKIFTVNTRKKYILAEPAIANVYVIPQHIYDAKGLLKNYKLADLTDPKISLELMKSEPALKEFADEMQSPKFTRETIVGSGPYKFVEWEDKIKVVFVKKKNWWGEAFVDSNKLFEAYPDTIEFLFILDDNTLAAALKDESIDVALGMNSRVFQDLKENEFTKERYNFFAPDAYSVLYNALNMKNPILADFKVRRALAHLTDLDIVIEELYEGLGTRIASPFPPDAAYYDKSLPLINYDLEKAKQLLTEAGWKDTDGDGILDKEIDGVQTDLSLTYSHGGSKFGKEYVQFWADKALEAGVKIIPQVMNNRKMMGVKIAAREYDIFASQATSDPIAIMDPYQFWHTDMDTPSGGNRTGFGTPESDKLIEEIRVTFDTEKRNAMMSELQKMIYDTQPWIILFAPKQKIVIHKKFEGKATSLRSGVHVNHLKLKDNK